MTDPGERRIKAKLDREWRDLIHNDLSSAAWYFEQRVQARIAADDREGVGFEMIAALTMTAICNGSKSKFHRSSCHYGVERASAIQGQTIVNLCCSKHRAGL